MLNQFKVPLWKPIPVVRLLLPFISGILLQRYCQFNLLYIAAVFACFVAAIIIFFFLSLPARYKLQSIQGILLNLLIIAFAALVTWQKDVQHQLNAYHNYYRTNSILTLRINEPLIDKPRSYKAEAVVESVINTDTAITCNGKLLLYFSKDTPLPVLQYGDRILVKKELQLIKNSGNPGAFDYQRYAAFQQITHTAFLKPGDWVLIPGNTANPYRRFIFAARERVINTLQKYIGSKDELSIAEALLIGYTNDLDKDLVQAYSNTGVVHIIAISGMHLALIYLLLVGLFSRLPFIKKSKPLQLILILICLWLFALMTGGSASVLRSAVMFSFIKTGQTFFKTASIFNSLAASAFVLLCYDPFYLWNVGFQLSYLAVIGIIVFQKPVYNLIYIKNKWIDKVWEMAAVTIAAQILTFPVCIYYFHQFPLLFLFTNIVAVPLSTLILYAAISLIIFSWLPFVATYSGKLVELLVWLMNKIIIWVNELSFAVWDNLPATVLSTWLMYIAIISLAVWVIKKYKPAFRFALLAILFFTALQAYSSWKVQHQQVLIVYNVPRCQAIDIIRGSRYKFIGDSILMEDGVLQNFHLKPARIQFQLDNRSDSLPGVFQKGKFLQVGNRKILLIDKTMIFAVPQQKIELDAIILSKNPKIKIRVLATIFNCKRYIFDASNSQYRIEQWKQECADLQIQYHSIPDSGSYTCNITD